MRNTEKPLTSGELSHRVDIEAPAGTLAEEMTLIASNVAAGIYNVSPLFQAKESIAAGGIKVPSYANVSMWYREDVRTSYVLVEKCHTRRRLQIQNLTPSNLGDAIDMVCVSSD